MTVKTKVNQDLLEEREKVTFSVVEFTNWYYGGEANVKDKRYLGKKVRHLEDVKFNFFIMT